MRVINNSGTTRTVYVEDERVYKINSNDYKYANKEEYNNYIKYKESEIPIVNKIYTFVNNVIEAERCITLSEYFKINNISTKSLDNDFMDELFLYEYKELGDKFNYGEKRDYILKNTDLSFEEFQVPNNWGINKDGELVLIDYSR